MLLTPEIQSRVVLLTKDQKIFTFFEHAINHIKGYQPLVEWYCATLPLFRETQQIFITTHIQHPHPPPLVGIRRVVWWGEGAGDSCLYTASAYT